MIRDVVFFILGAVIGYIGNEIVTKKYRKRDMKQLKKEYIAKNLGKIFKFETQLKKVIEGFDLKEINKLNEIFNMDVPMGNEEFEINSVMRDEIDGAIQDMILIKSKVNSYINFVEESRKIKKEPNRTNLENGVKRLKDDILKTSVSYKARVDKMRCPDFIDLD